MNTPTGTTIPLSQKPAGVWRSSRNALIVIGILIIGGVAFLIWGITTRFQSAPLLASSSDTAAETASNQAADQTVNELSQDRTGSSSQSQAQTPPIDLKTAPDPNKPPTDTANPGSTFNPAAYAAPPMEDEDPRDIARRQQIEALSTPPWSHTQTAEPPADGSPSPYSPAAAPDVLSALSALYRPGTPPASPTQTQPTNPPPLAPDDPAPYRRKPPAGKYMLPAGTSIPCRLDMNLVSELSGPITCMVTTAMYDKDQNLLIPMGAKLIGSYGNRLGYGATRILQVWSMIAFPDNSTLQLTDATDGVSADGSSGATGKINNHYGRLIANAAIMTVFGAGVALSQRQNVSLLTSPSVGSTIAGSVGNSLGNLMSETTRRDLELSPTNELAPGSRCGAKLKRSLVFDAPYEPYRQQ